MHDYLLISKANLPKEAPKDILNVVESLVYHHRRTPPGPSTTSRSTKRATSVEKPTFPGDWVIDRSKFLQELKKLHIHTKDYQGSSEYTTFKKQLEDESLSPETSSWENVSLISQRRDSEAIKKEKLFRPFSLTSLPPGHTMATSNSGSANGPGNSTTTTSHRNQRSVGSHHSQHEWTGVSQGEWNNLQGTIQSMNATNQAIQSTLEALQASIISNQQPQNEPQVPQMPQNTVQTTQSDSRWNAADLGFFDPLYDGKSTATGNAIEHSGKDTYFRDIHIFIERIRDIAQIKGDLIVRNNLYTCLRGTALTWYTSKLGEEQKRLVKLGNGVEEWIRVLLKKFRQSPSTAMAAVTRERYTMDDARRRREPIEYAQIITRAARSADMPAYNQIYLIYNGLDLEFRRDLPLPTESTDMDTFLSELETKKEIWWGIGARNKTGYGQQYSGYNANYAGYQKPMNGYTSNYQTYQREYQPQANRHKSYNNNSYSRPQPMDNSSGNRTYSTRYSTQGQYNRYSKGGDTTFNRQYPGQNNSNYRNQDPTTRQPTQPPAPGPAPPQRPRTPYQYDKGKQNTFQPRPPYYDPKTHIPRPVQPLYDQRQKAYYGDEDEYQEYPSDMPSQFDDQENVYNGLEEPHINDTVFLNDDEHIKDEAEEIPQNFFVDSPLSCNLSRRCRRCGMTFPSNNKLHRHLKECRQQAVLHGSIEPSSGTRMIKSDNRNIKSEGDYEIVLRKWHYLMIKASIINAILDFFCLDTGCGMSMIDRLYLCKLMPEYKLRMKESKPIKVRGIGTTIITSSESIELELDIPGLSKGKSATARIKGLFHIVDNLTAKILIGMDIIGPERMRIDSDKVQIGSCEDLIANLKSKSPTGPKIKRVVMSATAVTVPPHSNLFVSAVIRGKSKDLPDRDFVFNATHDQRLGHEGGIFSHIVDANFSCVQIRNTTDDSVFIPRRCRLGLLQEYEDEGCYLASPDDAHLAAGQWSTRTKKLSVRALLASPEAIETILPNGITIYGTPEATESIRRVTDQYPTLWTDDGQTIDVPPERWMPIDLKPDAKVSAARVYPLGPKEKALVDQEFDKLHAQGRMQYSSHPTAHGYPVFVTWRTILRSGQEPIKKGRVVVDIRALNKITETDTYPMPLQSDITSSVAGCKFISTVDATAFFHQWLVKLPDRHKFTVVTHRGQEQFNVGVMGFKNTPPYVQRQIDNILREFKDFCRAYIDDIVIFSKTLDEHIEHLHKVFELFNRLHISLSPTKSFLGYPTVQLLGLKVDAFGLSTPKEKLEAITNLKFPKTLQDLEIYLGFTGWLRGYIPYYAQKSEPLQARKTAMLRLSPSNKGRSRKAFSQAKFIENATQAELDSYEQIQEAFSRSSFLVHFDYTRPLYADIDASKKWGFGAMIYHDKSDAVYPSSECPKKSDVQPILFLSRLLTDPERRYWPTELEMAGLVWVVKRIRHMIESAKATTVIFTDHSANPSIVKQTTLNSGNTDKLNLRLVRASAYLSQFNIDVRYKTGKSNVIPDALSRLPSNNSTRDSANLDTLEIDNYHNAIEDISTLNHAFQGSLVSMTSEFKARLIQGYSKEKSWSKIIKMLEDLRKRTSTETIEDDEPVKTGIDFELHGGLIYHKENRRLCIPVTLEQEIFKLAHDQNQHSGATRCFHRIRETIFIPRLSRKLRVYIDHCPQCQLNQTVRHKAYGELMPIVSPAIPFHTVAMDFIMAIPDDFDTLLTITCKFSKRLTIIPGKSTYSAKDWAIEVMNRLLTADWGIPAAIISDRDPKFLSEFWDTIFRRLGVSLLTSTAYHAQTDGQSERSNQTVEIAIRFLTSNDPDVDIIAALPTIQSQLNNSPNASTALSPNEIIYGFKVRDTISALNLERIKRNESTTNRRQEYQAEASDAIAFANAKMKVYYDSRHKPLLLKPGDKAYLRLNKGYKLPEHHQKLSQRRCGPFLVKRRVGRLAYELDLPSTWKIHPVISIAQLEPASGVQDPYNRPRPHYPDAVEIEGDTEDQKSYEVERVLAKRIRKFGRTAVTQYLIKWLGYGPEFNEWKSLSALDHCLELIEEFEQRQPDRTPR